MEKAEDGVDRRQKCCSSDDLFVKRVITESVYWKHGAGMPAISVLALVNVS